MQNQLLHEAASRYLTKYKKRLSPDNGVPAAPPVATRQSPGLVPPRLHKRQPQKGTPSGR